MGKHALHPQGRLKKIPNLFSDGLSISQSHTRKGINVGVSSPATDAVQSAIQSARTTADQAQYAGGGSNSRTNAMAAVNTGIGAYRTAQSAQEAYQSIQSGSGFKPTVT
ncbi:hypothetical protein, partial [Neisseria dentiae]|uniref:hypothetical protein n=1 Tax=Neisseria dentiae TaxID=194197 RepID=UPI00211CB438